MAVRAVGCNPSSRTPQVMLESQDEQRLVDYCKSEGLICEKVKFTQAGYPDRLIVIPFPVHIWIEFKRPLSNEKPEPIQLYRMHELREATAFCGWTNDSGIAIRAVATILDATRIPKESNPALAVAECRRLIFGPRTGKNLNLSGGNKNIEIERLRIKDAHSSALEAYVQSLAR
jgi:hypothetical protein